MALSLRSLKRPKITKTQQQCLFPAIMTQLLKIIHRPSCEQFYVGTILLSYTHKLYQHSEGSVHLLAHLAPLS